MSFRKLTKLCFFSLLLCLLFSCAEQAFNTAKEKDTIEAYDEFLDDYQDSEYASEAAYLREKAFYKAVKEQNEISTYDAYLTEYPSGEFVNEVLVLREKRAYEVVIANNDVESCNQFLSVYPESEYAPEITQLKEKLVYENSTQENTYESYQKYLEQFPEGQYIAKVERLQKKAAWETVQAENTIRGYNQYLQENSESWYRRDALEKLFQLYQDRDTIDGYKSFIENYPNAPQNTDAQRRIDQLYEERYLPIFEVGKYFDCDTGVSEEEKKRHLELNKDKRVLFDAKIEKFKKERKVYVIFAEGANEPKVFQNTLHLYLDTKVEKKHSNLLKLDYDFKTQFLVRDNTYEFDCKIVSYCEEKLLFAEFLNFRDCKVYKKDKYAEVNSINEKKKKIFVSGGKKIASRNRFSRAIKKALKMKKNITAFEVVADQLAKERLHDRVNDQYSPPQSLIWQMEGKKTDLLNGTFSETFVDENSNFTITFITEEGLITEAKLLIFSGYSATQEEGLKLFITRFLAMLNPKLDGKTVFLWVDEKIKKIIPPFNEHKDFFKKQKVLMQRGTDTISIEIKP